MSSHSVTKDRLGSVTRVSTPTKKEKKEEKRGGKEEKKESLASAQPGSIPNSGEKESYTEITKNYGGSK